MSTYFSRLLALAAGLAVLVTLMAEAPATFAAEAVETATEAAGTGDAVVLSHDDGAGEGRKSIAGSGHFVSFSCPPGKWYLVAVDINASRYGEAAPPKEDWNLSICSDEMKTLRTIKKPYSIFQRGGGRWYKIEVPPLVLPKSEEGKPGNEFYVHFGFAPTDTKGVYVTYDSSDRECFSKTGIPDWETQDIPEKYDWMIRLEITQTPPADVPAELGKWLGPLHEIKYDDGKSDGRRSMGGAGPAVRYINVPKGAVLEGFSMYAARYGRNYDPRTTMVTYWIIDDTLKVLHKNTFPYSCLDLVDRWCDVVVNNVPVEGTFWVLIEPQAETRKGIYFNYDKDIGQTHSKVAKDPQHINNYPEKLEWMIRAYVRLSPEEE